MSAGSVRSAGFESEPFIAPDVIRNARHALSPCASDAAIHILLRLNAMADNAATAMRADRRQFVDRTFKRIENVPFPIC